MNTTNQIIKFIDENIYYKRKDNLLNHLKTFFRNDNIEFSGECYNNFFCIWRRSNWSGIFYPLVLGQVLIFNSEVTIVLKTKLNSAGFLIAVIIYLGFFFSLSGFQFEDITVKKLFLAFTFASLPIIALALGYSRERKKASNDIQSLLKMYKSEIIFVQ